MRHRRLRLQDRQERPKLVAGIWRDLQPPVGIRSLDNFGTGLQDVS